MRITPESAFPKRSSLASFLLRPGVRGRGTTARKGVLLGGAVLTIGQLASAGAWAQCTDNFDVALRVNNVLFPAQNALPLGKGPSVGAFLSTINTVNTAFLTTTS